jgi:phospholipase/carboxylesterase
MKKMKKIYGPEYAPRSGEKAKKLVIFIHGYGSNGMDLISLADYLNVELEEFHFCAPNAPFSFNMAYNSYQWFNLDERSETAILKSMRENIFYLENFIEDKVKQLDISYKDVFLVGFSQGSMLSLYLAPRQEEEIGGVVALSGALINGENLKNEIKHKPPILLVHGEIDEVVGIDEFFKAKELLKQLKFDLQAVSIKRMGHSINEEVIELMKNFLRLKSNNN